MNLAPIVLALLSLPASAAPPPLVPGVPRPAVLVDVAADGVVWAKGRGYKMRFSADGATYRPAFGVRAARGLVLDLSFGSATVGGAPLPTDGAAPPLLEGTTVTFDRGSVVERYALAVDTVEQSFLVPRRPGGGDLVLRLGGGTDLEYVGRDGGLRFRHAGAGDVRYGDVTVIDARGRTWGLESAFVDGALELTVPAAIVAAARYPLVIDPTIVSVLIDTDGDDDENPDVAYSTTANEYLVVYEEVASANDRDIVSRRFDDDGTFVEEVAVDISIQDTIDPAVAATGGEFLVVWNALGAGFLGDNVIRARSRLASGPQQGAPFDVSVGSREEQNPEVGGSAGLAPTPFLVAWDEKPLLSSRLVRCRFASGQGAITAEITLGFVAVDEVRPVVPKDGGAAGRWLVAFEQESVGSSSLGLQLVKADGTVAPTVHSLAHTTGDPFRPAVDGDGDRWVVAYENPDSNDPTHRDVIALRVEADSSGGFSVLGALNVGKAGVAAGEAVDQLQPCVAAEGARYTVGYVTPNGVSGRDVRAISFMVTASGSSTMIEKEFVVASSLGSPRDLAACSTRADRPGESFIAWTRIASLASDHVEGGIVSALAPGGVEIVQTGCGTSEPALLTTSVPALGATFGLLTLNFQSTSPLLFIGKPVNLPFCPAQASCALGATPDIQLTVPGFVQGTLPSDGALLGLKIAMQGIDLLPANDPGPKCGPPDVGATFRTTDTLVLTLQ